MTYGIAVPHTGRAWTMAVGVVLVASLGLVALFWADALGVYRVWVESTAYNHCFLVLPLVGYMIWERRATLSTTVPRPQLWTLAAIPFLSALWLVAASLGIHEAEQMVVLTILQAIFLSTLGWTAYRRLMAPLLYLYFLVPSGEYLAPSLQDFTARMVVHGLHLVGVPVFSDGVFIEIPAGKFVIAEECAGLRFLIASVAYGVFFSVITYRSWVRRSVFSALSVIVPIIANGMRAFGIVYAAEIVGSPAAVMADHVIYGWGFFSVILVLLTLIGRSFADRDARPRASAGPRSEGFFPVRCGLAALLGLVLAGLGPVYAAVLDRQSPVDLLAQAEPPRVGSPWRPLTEAVPDDWSPVVIGADRTFLDAWTDGESRLYRFVALYVAHGRVNNLIRSENRLGDEKRWRVATSRTATIDISGRAERVNISEVVSGERRRLVVSFYVVDGAVTVGALSVKLHQLRSLLSRGRPVSALVAVAL